MILDELKLSWKAKESLAGKVALVTGASSGIGASIAKTGKAWRVCSCIGAPSGAIG